MVEVEPWFIGLVAGLATLILVLLCIIVIFCTVWARRDRARKRQAYLQHRQQQLQQQQLASINNDVVEVHSNSMALVPTNNNANWYFKEKPPEEFRSQSTLTRAAGDEPFIVGNSILRYSKELDRSSSYNYRPATADKYLGHHSSSQWNGRPVQTMPRLEPAPNQAETRMVRLGMIPPRPASANGNIPLGYYTEPGRGKSAKAGKDGKQKLKEIEEERPTKIAPRPMSANGHIPSGHMTEPGKKSPKGKDGKRKSKELEDSLKYKGEVLVPVREVQLWPVESSSNQAPFPLPKEDYDTNGATWYYSRPADGQILTPSKSETFVYAPSATDDYHRHGSLNVNGRIVVPSSPTRVVSANTVDQFHAVEDQERLKRVMRVGVPILPD